MIVQTSEFQSCLPNNKQSQSASQPARQPKCSINYILIYAYFRFFVLTLLLNLLIITLAALVWLFFIVCSFIYYVYVRQRTMLATDEIVSNIDSKHTTVFFFSIQPFLYCFIKLFFFTFKQNTTGSCCIHLRPVLYFFFQLRIIQNLMYIQCLPYVIIFKQRYWWIFSILKVQPRSFGNNFLADCSSIFDAQFNLTFKRSMCKVIFSPI